MDYRVCLAAAVLALTACAAFRPTPYQQAGEAHYYGYTDERIDPERFEISVHGNAATSGATVRDQVLRRAAEISLDHGHDYFALRPHGRGRLVRIRPAFVMPQVGSGAGPIGHLVQTENYAPGVVPSEELIASATIKLTDASSSDEDNVFNAHEVLASLGAKPQAPRRDL